MTGGRGAGVSTTGSHCTCPTSHVPHTTDTVPSSATSKALSEAGMHVLCDTPHATLLYMLGVCTSVHPITLSCCCRKTWREMWKRVSQRFVRMTQMANTVKNTVHFESVAQTG